MRRNLGFIIISGLAMLLGWREVFPWLSALMTPTLMFSASRGDLWEIGAVGLACLVLSWTTAPAQAVVSWARSLTPVRRRRGAGVASVLLSPLYQEWRNLVRRVAVLTQLRGEHHRVITPRTSPVRARRVPAVVGPVRAPVVDPVAVPARAPMAVPIVVPAVAPTRPRVESELSPVPAGV